MNVLVTVATRHGSTGNIGQAIADELQRAGLDARFLNVGDVGTLTEYDAVVLGSGVYMGRWLEEARQFIERHAQDLAVRPVWLFSSGPLGSDINREAMRDEQSTALLTTTNAREHRTFAGNLDHSRLSTKERLVVRIVRAPYGDYRNWEEIRLWANQIAETLSTLGPYVKADGSHLSEPPVPAR